MKTTTIVLSLVALATFVTALPAALSDSSQADGAGHLHEIRWSKWWNKKKPLKNPFEFTSTYAVVAVPGEVIATNQTVVSGQPGAIGYYNFGINKDLDTICYNITLIGVDGTYQSPAKTATHIHEAVKGRAGPPRLAFPNPVADADNANVRRSAGCLTGPFTTGVLANGTDTATGFKVAQIEANPAGFFADIHTNLYTSGVVRGQLG